MVSQRVKVNATSRVGMADPAFSGMGRERGNWEGAQRYVQPSDMVQDPFKVDLRYQGSRYVLKTRPPHMPGTSSNGRTASGGLMNNGLQGTIGTDSSPTLRFDGTGRQNDSGTKRWRGPWFHAGYYIPAPQTQVDWTGAGPIPVTLHMYTRQDRLEQGRNWIEGLHTDPPVAQSLSQKFFRQQPATRGPRQNRLTVPRYRGQSYSTTTVTIGGTQ